MERQSECEAAAGSEETIVSMVALRKDFCCGHILIVAEFSR